MGNVVRIVTIGFALAIAALFLLSRIASAHDDGRYANDPLKPWFDQLASGKGLCCSFADGKKVEDVDWDNLGSTENGNSGYRVRLDGEWVDVPSNALITEPNKAGFAIVWPTYQHYEHGPGDGENEMHGVGPGVRCFIPGPGAQIVVDRVHIPHGGELAPGTWYVLRDGTLLHRCPQCKRGSEMLNHSVEPNGEVNASIACFSPCTYHVWGILDGWSHGKKEAGKRVTMPKAE